MTIQKSMILKLSVAFKNLNQKNQSRKPRIYRWKLITWLNIDDNNNNNRGNCRNLFLSGITS